MNVTLLILCILGTICALLLAINKIANEDYFLSVIWILVFILNLSGTIRELKKIPDCRKATIEDVNEHNAHIDTTITIRNKISDTTYQIVWN